MAGAPARDQRHLAWLEVAPPDKLVLRAERNDIRMGGREARQPFSEHQVRSIDEFLHEVPSEVSFFVAEAGEAPRDFCDGFVEHPIPPRVAQIGYRECELARPGRLPHHIEPSRMRFRIRGQELAAVGCREVADLEDRLEVLQIV